MRHYGPPPQETEERAMSTISTPASVTNTDGPSGVLVATLDEDLLLERYAQERRPELEAELVRRFMPLARSLAMRYRGGVEPNDDLLQVASLALLKALRGYDPERGRRFAAYAAPTILGELRRHFRDHAWRLHMPRSLQESSLRVERVSATLADEFGATPTVGQIADRLGVSEEDVLDALQARESQRAASLDMPVHRDESESVPTVETIGSDDLGFDRVEAQAAVERCGNLEDRERAVIQMRFDEDLNQYEIGERLGISQMQVSRLLRRALAKLLEAVQGDAAPSGRRTFADDGHDPRFPTGRIRRRSRRRAPAHAA
jgi:RNA polymerase sigma-B factor